MLEVCEIFRSIQGESTFAGKCCSFVRLSGCNLDCAWCDTPYARAEKGTIMSVESIVEQIAAHGPGIIEITGGEPLVQADTPELCRQLAPLRKTILIETNGACDISVLPRAVVRVVDVKTPSSGHADRFLQSNIGLLRPLDQCKFVIATRQDFEWACEFVKTRNLTGVCVVLFSPVLNLLEPSELARWILEASLDVRMGLQLHKFIWSPETRGV